MGKKIFAFIDVQHDFMNKNGALYVPGAENIKPTIAKLNDLAKSENIPVIMTRDWHDGSEPEMKENGGPFPQHCIIDSDGATIIIEASNKKAKIFDKRAYDVFDKNLGNKEIVDWLKKNDVTEAWVAGVATDYCIKAAVLGFLKYGIATYVFENAIRGVDQKTSEMAIKEMKKAGAHFAVAKL
jgi:nicotinamidase/pyrazinamidase